MTKTNKQTNKQTFQLSGPPLPLHDVIDPHMFTTPHAILRTLSSTSRLLIKILKINGEPGGGGGGKLLSNCMEGFTSQGNVLYIALFWVILQSLFIDILERPLGPKIE